MADANNNAAGNAGNRANAPPPRGGVYAGANPRSAPAVMQLNPERAPALISKWQKLLDKDLEKIEIVYEANGVTVYLFGKEGTPYYKEDSGVLSVAEYKAIKAEAAKPSADEALRAFKDKFELRLNRPFPTEGGPASGSDADIRVFLETQEFSIRRAMLMSGKQFKAAYPNGFPQV